MNKKILKKLFIIFIFIFAFKSISFGEDETIFKHYISTKETELRFYPYETGQVIGMLNKDVRVKTLCLNNNWLLADIKYLNLSAVSLDELNLHFNGWINKNDFKEVYLDEKSADDIDIKSPSVLNTLYSPEDKPDETMYKNLWEKEKKFYLPLHSTGSDLFLLPNISNKDHKTALIAYQTPFIVILKALDWKKQEWMEIAFYSSESELQKFWIKRVEVISEDEKKIKDALILERERKNEEKNKIKDMENGVDNFLEGFGQKM